MDRDKIDILIEEYKARTAEIINENQRYHRQTNFTYLYFSAIIGIITALSSDGRLRCLLARINWVVDQGSLALFYFILLFLAAIIGFYLFASVIDALRTLYLHSFRRGVIERLLNEGAGQKLLVWDSEIIFSHLFFDKQLIRDKKGICCWVKPNILVALWVFLFFITANLMLCFLCSVIAKEYWLFYSLIAAAGTLFSIHQWFALHYTGILQMQEEVEAKSGIKINKQQDVNNNLGGIK